MDWNDSQMAGVIQSIYQLFIGNSKSPQRPQVKNYVVEVCANVKVCINLQTLNRVI